MTLNSLMCWSITHLQDAVQHAYLFERLVRNDKLLLSAAAARLSPIWLVLSLNDADFRDLAGESGTIQRLHRLL